ncbi:MAG: lamin tail domain-containing protein, partial [bacterium]|nr:lamin tail domain-containing protein [bacterium]
MLFLFFSPNLTFAKSFKIESEDINRIDLALDLVKTWGNLVLPQEFQRVLNTTVTSTDIGKDITYGLLVLSAVNEMEMIDRVISQRYKQEATEYFNNILDQQLNLLGYYKGLGFDIARIHFAKNVGGPISALTLNTFDMTNKVIVALLAIENLKRENFYDGLWRYFDARRNGSVHQEAWGDAAVEMGFLPTTSMQSFGRKSSTKSEIELQFRDLWEKWKPYTNAFGVKKEFKDQFKDEMQSVILEAAEAYIAANAAQKTEIGFVQSISKRVVEFGQKIKQGIVWAAEKTKAFVGKIGSFIASLTSKETGAGLSITILDDNDITKDRPSSKNSTIVVNSPDDNAQKPQEKPAEYSGDRNNVTAEGILNQAKDEAKGKQSEQRNLQILIPRLLAQEREKQQREKEQNVNNLVNLSFGGCKDGQININAANAALLDELTGIGPVKAQSIIEFRTQQAFYKVDDLTKVSGIGEATLVKIKEQNLACAENPSNTSFIPFQKTAATADSGTPPPTPGGSAGTPTFLKLLITEVQTAGTSSQTEEFIEFYNPNDSKIELHDWYLQKKTQSATDFSSFVSKTLFESEQIAAHGYFLIARQGSSFESSADVVTTSSLADNNVLALKNPNGEISDKVGWGSVLDYEGSPASNPTAGKSLTRKYGSSYQDIDNNSQDFEEKDPTPKAVNNDNYDDDSSSSDSSSSEDTTLPEVVFDSLSVTQTTTFFNLGWTGSDAQGIDNYFAQYTVSPSADGIFLQYATTGTWQNWETGSTGEITLDSIVNSVSLTAQDGIEYMFSLTAKDAAGNESSTASASTSVCFVKNVGINEIAWAGTKADSSEEWIELYNNTSASIDLA